MIYEATVILSFSHYLFLKHLLQMCQAKKGNCPISTHLHPYYCSSSKINTTLLYPVTGSRLHPQRLQPLQQSIIDWVNTKLLRQDADRGQGKDYVEYNHHKGEDQKHLFLSSGPQA